MQATCCKKYSARLWFTMQRQTPPEVERARRQAPRSSIGWSGWSRLSSLDECEILGLKIYSTFRAAEIEHSKLLRGLCENNDSFGLDRAPLKPLTSYRFFYDEPRRFRRSRIAFRARQIVIVYCRPVVALLQTAKFWRSSSKACFAPSTKSLDIISRLCTELSTTSHQARLPWYSLPSGIAQKRWKPH